ncbi:Eco57I restriction-modification methylase domain-containing protein [Ralstonia insidiosa]|nr:SAM-dependent methyltransferase [Ralstonia insidiosa]MBA9939315.1 SAM-dependent methyltransferase [Ralstonia insidiosa]MBC9968086.1 N-6 DNA methylase [Ralstonia insidiosa]MBX3904351.1 N-6 DNA methylase [Ralstonia insidiosa]
MPAETIDHQHSQLSQVDQARAEAVEQLHHATAIYTAAPVVDQLLERLDWPREGRRLVDPSCGDGMFLERALGKLLAACGQARPSGASLRAQVEGWEVHTGACIEARARVAATLCRHGYDHATATEVAESMVHNRDFLTDGPRTPTYHAVAGNPPYLRWVNVPRVLQDEYSSHVPDFAANDLLHSFLERCSRSIHTDGQIGMVTADRWLINSGASALRAALGARLAISHLERLDARSVFYRPKNRRAGTPPRIHPVSVVLNATARPVEASEPFQDMRVLTERPIYPGVDESRYEGMPTLDQFAEVRIAPWLGSSGIFVVDEDTAATLPGEYLVPAVDTDDIVSGRLGAPKRFAIRTKPGVEPCGAVMEHLQRHMHKMAVRGRRGAFWLPPETFHRMDLSRETLLVPRIATSPKAVRVPPGILPINHNLSIVCGEPAVLDRVEAALRSPLAAQWVRDYAPRLENGYFSLCTTLLRKMPIDVPFA